MVCAQHRAVVVQFAREVKVRLSVVATMAPSERRYCALLRSHPGLLHMATPMWFSSWPDDALTAVATAELSFAELTPASPSGATTFRFGTFVLCVDRVKS